MYEIKKLVTSPFLNYTIEQYTYFSVYLNKIYNTNESCSIIFTEMFCNIRFKEGDIGIYLRNSHLAYFGNIIAHIPL